jgi:hypothetical protein
MAALRGEPRSVHLGKMHGKSVHRADESENLQSRAVAVPHETQLRPKPALKMKDPSGGTTGRVKLYGALGVDGRSRRIQPMGRDYRSHVDKSQDPRGTFKTPDDFFNPVFRDDRRKIAARQAILRRLRPICPLPSRAGARSMRDSRKCYPRPGLASALSPPPAYRIPKQAEPPAQRPRR